MSRGNKIWRLCLIALLLILMLLGEELIRRHKLLQFMPQELQEYIKPQCPVTPNVGPSPEPCICDTKESLPKRTFDDTPGLASMQLQTRTELIEELRRNWLKPPSEEPYNLVSTEKRADMHAVRKSHRAVLRILKDKRNGFFIECGAFDGVFISNTLHLEQSYNWTGLLIEADLLSYENLVKAHRKAWIINACLAMGNEPEKMKMTRLKDDRLRTIVSKMDPNMINRAQTEYFEAQCFPLGSILAALGQSLNVDYLSLDVEQAELAVLSTIPWDFIYIKVITAECIPTRIVQLKAYLESQNYIFVGQALGPWIHDCLFIHRFYEKEMGFPIAEVQKILNG